MKVAALSIEKAMSFCNAANAHFGTVIVESKAKGNEKTFWQMQQKRLEAIKRDILSYVKDSQQGRR